jgi:hypothetical protein
MGLAVKNGVGNWHKLEPSEAFLEKFKGKKHVPSDNYQYGPKFILTQGTGQGSTNLFPTKT